MATWVEGKPAAPSKTTLSDVNDIVNETKSPWTRVSPLSDASNKTLELATPISPHIFDNDGKLNYNLGSVTKPVTGPKPRFSPRPFSLEKSPVPYASLGTTQPPLTAPKPISVVSKVTPSGKLAVDTGDANASFRHTEAKPTPSGTVLSVLSSFVQKSSTGSDNISWVRAGNSQDESEKLFSLHSTPKLCNVAVSSSTTALNSERITDEKSEHSEIKPTTLVILETSVQKLKSKKSSEGDKDIGKWTSRDSLQDQELQGTMEPFMLSKPSIHSRKYSPSATQGLGTSNPTTLLRATSLGFLGKWDQVTEEGKDKRDSIESPSSPRVQLRKPRPLSAWLPGTTNDQKSESLSESTIKHDEKAFTHEKPGLKKPRPLSMDLTARFEVVGPSAHKRNVPPSEDSKENVPIIKAASALPSEMRHDATVQQEDSTAETEKCWSSASQNDHKDETKSYLFAAKKKFSNTTKMDISKKDVRVLTLYERDNKEKITSPERKLVWGNYSNNTKTTAGHREEEKEERMPTTSLKTEKEKLGTDLEQLKSWSNKELDKECSDLERASDDENSSLGSDDRGNKGRKVPVSGGIIKRRISLLLDSASSSSSTAKTDCPQTTTEKEKMSIRVRQRIQSFISENNDSKREQFRSSQRHSFQPRPLSSDITKRFETRAIGDEGHSEKQMDLAVFSSPEHSVLQNTQEQGGRESLEKENEDKTDLTKNERLHLMDTEFKWSRGQSVKKVSKGFDKSTTDEKTCSEKIGRRSSFSRKEEEMKGQINETVVPLSVASMTKVGTESSDGQKTVTALIDSDLSVKAVRVSVIENYVQRHKVPEPVHSEDPSYSVNSCFDKDKRSERNAQSGLKNYTTVKSGVEAMPKETNKTTFLELEAAPLERKKNIYFETEEKRVSRSSVKTPPSSKITEQNVSGLLLPTSYGKIDILQNVSETAVSCSLPKTSEDRVLTLRSRKLHSMIDQTKLEEKVSDARRRMNQSLPAENSSILETLSTAQNSEIKVAELLDTVQNQQSHIEVLTTAKVDLDKVGKKQLKRTQLNSHTNTEILSISNGSSRVFGLRKYNEVTNQELLTSAGSVDVKQSKGNDDVEACKETKGLLQGDGTIEFCGQVLPKENKRRKKISLEPNSTIFTKTGQVSDVKHRYTSELLTTSVSQSDDRSKDGFFEEYSKSYPKMSTPEKPKKTLLSEAFLDMPWTNGGSDASEKDHVTPTVKQSEIADTEAKSRKTRNTLDRNRHSILDLDALMAEYKKETSKRKSEESKVSHCHDKKDNHSSNTHQKDYEEQCTQKVRKSADQSFGISSSSAKSRDSSDRLNKKGLHRNSILDLDALMAEYGKGISKPGELVPKTSSSKLIDGKTPTVKIQKSSSFREVRTSQKNDRIKKRHDEEFKRDACDSASADKGRSKDEKRKSRPSSAYNEYDELEKYELRSNGQKSEGKRNDEVDAYTSALADLKRRPKHEKKKSRPSSTYIERSELDQPVLHADGQKSDGVRDKGKPREDDHSEPMPRNRKNRGEERKSKVTPVETDCPTQTFDGHCPDGKTGNLDYLTSSGKPVHGSSQLVSEKEKHVEISIDNRQCEKIENRPAGRKEEPEQKSPRILNEYPKDLSQSVPEAKKSRPLEIHRQTQKAVDGLLTNQEGTPSTHQGRKSYSTGGAQSRVTETLMRAFLSRVEDKTDSHCVEREQPPDLQSKTRRQIRDMIQLTAKAKKQNENETYSRRSVQQEKCQDHKSDRVKQCCINASTKGKDTDALVQERDQYGTYEERGYSTNEECEPYNKYEEHKQNEEENCRPVLPYKEPATTPVVSPKRQLVQSRVSSPSSQSEMTPAIERPSSIQDPRSISFDHSSGELESLGDTDSSQSACPSTHVDLIFHGFSFLEPVTVLDSGAQKSRIQLGRKTLRRAPTKHRKTGFGDQPNDTDQLIEKSEDPWMYKDSTECRPIVQEELVEEEVRRPEKLTVSQCQRVAMFPGMDPSVLKASLRRNRPEDEVVADAASNDQCCRSSKPPAQQGFRVLPPAAGKREGSEETSPPWLQELKSKKRLSQHQPCSPDWNNE
ncbi:uncharacterized protein KIAA1671-like [Heptranchias perlo]|uniref:uncharacterized protein KIAA1671-like n=1 Tax=Heptranchias perlo TaxID=212740 RepID=UPI00355A4787